MPLYFSPPRLRVPRLFQQVLLLTFLLGAAGATSAATLSVPTGTYPTIQSAIDASTDGDTVLIADGTYTGLGNVDIDFSGKNITVTSQHGAASTIIDCGGSSSADHRGFILQNNETSAVISGLTIENGYESGDSGGGIINLSAVVTVTKCIFSANTASYLGGGIYNAGTATISSCIFSTNIAVYGGGAFDNGAATVTNCIFTNNAATYGGGFYNENSDMIANCTFSGNADSGVEGGLFDDGTAVLLNDIFWGDVNETNAYSVTFCDIQGGYVGAGNIDIDPDFVSGADLHLQSGSPCLGAGTGTGAPATDKDDHTRPNPPSIGAYELTLPVHLLWTNTDGHASVWNMNDPNPAATCRLFGPYPGWKAVGLAEGPNGSTRLLWDNTDGRVSVWNLSDPNPDQTCVIYGPYAGWKAVGIMVGPDNAVHLLWDNTDGRVSLWNLSDPNPEATCLVYGPYTGWKGIGIAEGPDGHLRLQWDNSDGRVSVWNLGDAHPDQTCLVYGPYAGWTAACLSVGPDNAAHLLWDTRDGRISLWDLSDADPAATCQVEGPYAGWAGVGLAVGSDNAARLLWDNTSGSTAGEASLWNFSDPNPVASCLLYGPYSGWTAVDISAAP